MYNLVKQEEYRRVPQHNSAAGNSGEAAQRTHSGAVCGGYGGGGKSYGKREKGGVCAPCEPPMPGSGKRPQQPHRERTAGLCAMI